MAKRLTPEEDAQLIRSLDRDGSRGRLISPHNDDFYICIDKDAQQMEVVREGERFLEVRFKRRESADKPQGNGAAVTIIAVDEMVPWGEPVGIARTLEEAQRNYMDREVAYGETRADLKFGDWRNVAAADVFPIGEREASIVGCDCVRCDVLRANGR